MTDALRRHHHRHRRGRRHARPPARPDRQAHPAARARRLPAARARELGLQGGLPQGALPQRRGVDRQGRQALPPARSSTSSAATPSSTARSSSACASATSARSATTAASPRPGRSTYDDLEPYYTEAEQLYLVHGERGEDPTEPPALGPVPVPGRLARAAHPAAPRRLRAAPATTRSTCRSASTSTRPTPRAGRCVRCDRFDGFPCLTDGKADAHVLLRAAGARARRTSRCAPTRKVERLETDAGGRTRHRGRRRPRAASEETLQRRRRRRLLRRGQLGGAAAALGVSDRHPNGLANSSDVVGRHYMAHINSARDRDLADARTRRSSRRRSASTTTTGAPTDFELPARAHPDARQVATATSCGRAPRGSRPGWRSTTWPGTRSTSG